MREGVLIGFWPQHGAFLTNHFLHLEKLKQKPISLRSKFTSIRKQFDKLKVSLILTWVVERERELQFGLVLDTINIPIWCIGPNHLVLARHKSMYNFNTVEKITVNFYLCKVIFSTKCIFKIYQKATYKFWMVFKIVQQSLREWRWTPTPKKENLWHVNVWIIWAKSKSGCD